MSPCALRYRPGGWRRSPAVLAAVVSLLLAAAPASAAGATSAAATDTISYEEITVGMKGQGRTVFLGSTVESFDVEIIGKLSNIAPKRNVILARLSGGPLAQTGVMQGMSGSPVYIGGRLAGAVAYSWEFSTEPICGITPIDEMLDLLTRKAEHERGTSRQGARSLPAGIETLAYPAAIGDFLRDRLVRTAGAAAPGGLVPLPIPMGFPAGARSGAAGAELGRWEGTFSRLGLSPVSTGSAAGERGTDEAPIVPGSAIGVQLIRGDVQMAAVGTVTWVGEESFLAMGHNFLALGPTALPATRAEVFGFLPSVASSFKLAAATSPVGMVTQDRFGGIAGSTSGSARVVPVELTLASDVDRVSTFSFEIVDDPLLTPILMHLSFLQIFSTAEKAAGDITLAIKKGSKIRMEGGLDVNVENLYSGEQSELIASATVAYMTYLLMNNPDRASRVEGVNLDLEYADQISLARIDRIWTERYKVSPGETVPLYVSVKPYRGAPFVEVVPLEIPEEAPEGKAILQVGDAITLSRMEYEAGGISFEPRDLEQLVFLLNRLRANNRIYATLIRPDNGIFISGERLPNLPPSVSTVLVNPERDNSGAVKVRFRGILEAERETRYTLRGYQKSILEIRR